MTSEGQLPDSIKEYHSQSWQLGDSFKKVKLARTFQDSLSYEEKVAFLDVETGLLFLFGKCKC